MFSHSSIQIDGSSSIFNMWFSRLPWALLLQWAREGKEHGGQAWEGCRSLPLIIHQEQSQAKFNGRKLGNCRAVRNHRPRHDGRRGEWILMNRQSVSLGDIERRNLGTKQCTPVQVSPIQKVLVWGVPIMAQRLTNLTSIHEDTGSIPSLAQWVKDLVLLWLWCRRTAVASIRPVDGNRHMPQMRP